MTDRRQVEIEQRLRDVRERIARAATTVGRAPDDVVLTVVTKFFPASDVGILAGLGVTDVGENRHQEAQAKQAACAGLPLRWHYVGGLQSNKAAAVAGYADVVESVDRVKVLNGLARGAAERGDGPLDCLVQVSLDPPEAGAGRSGVDPADLPTLADAVAERPELRLAGLMAVAPLGEDPARAFARLAGIRDSFLAAHPDATDLSAGMSGDLEAAIEAGATHVRIGRAVLGERPLVQ